MPSTAQWTGAGPGANWRAAARSATASSTGSSPCRCAWSASSWRTPLLRRARCASACLAAREDALHPDVRLDVRLQRRVVRMQSKPFHGVKEGTYETVAVPLYPEFVPADVR